MKLRRPLAANSSPDIAARNRPLFVSPIHKSENRSFVLLKFRKPPNELPDLRGMRSKIMGAVGVDSDAGAMRFIMDIATSMDASVEHDDLAPCIRKHTGHNGTCET